MDYLKHYGVLRYQNYDGTRIGAARQIVSKGKTLDQASKEIMQSGKEFLLQNKKYTLGG